MVDALILYKGNQAKAGKLDSYKEDRQKGVVLNEDQKLAVSKYSEVISLLDLSKDTQKSVTQVTQEIQKFNKKQARRDQAERQQHELSRIKEALSFQNILINIDAKNVHDDLLSGSNGAAVVSEEMLGKLDEFYALIYPNPEDMEESTKTFDELMHAGSEHLVNLIDSKTKEVCGTTYKEINQVLRQIIESNYFDKNDSGKEECQKESKYKNEVEKEKDDNIASEEVEPAITPSQQTPPTQVPTADTEVSHPPGQYNNNQQQNARNTANFNFLQDSEIDLESPHMDPAVVMAHPMAPAPQPAIPSNVPFGQGNNVESVFHPAAAGDQVQQTQIQPNESREDFNPTQPIPSQTFTNQNYNAPLSQSFANIQHPNGEFLLLHPSHENPTARPPPPIPMPNPQAKTQDQSSFGTTSQLGFNNTDSQGFDQSTENENINGTTDEQLCQNSESTNSGFTSQQNRSSYGGNRGNQRRNGNRGTSSYRPRGGFQNGRGGYQGATRENYYHSNNFNGNRDAGGNFRGKGTRGAGGTRGGRARGGYNRAEQ
ncbi:Caprin-1 [Nymphon striatum]|nr:Caprin-1 [Nymphon striatum]